MSFIFHSASYQRFVHEAFFPVSCVVRLFRILPEKDEENQIYIANTYACIYICESTGF